MTNIIGKGALAALAGAAALALTATGASAFVVCNDRGDCWHSTVRYDYPQVKVVYYDDNWDWKAHHYHWHDVSGTYGYWDSDKNAWVEVHPAHGDGDHDSDDH
ncbi:MAG: hypothetical protein JOZ72_08580 [Alphaproteobacteria bacterium]|nr:hypothetical protein [Alphaproteobacteria bacterium]